MVFYAPPNVSVGDIVKHLAEFGVMQEQDVVRDEGYIKVNVDVRITERVPVVPDWLTELERELQEGCNA